MYDAIANPSRARPIKMLRYVDRALMSGCKRLNDPGRDCTCDQTKYTILFIHRSLLLQL